MADKRILFLAHYSYLEQQKNDKNNENRINRFLVVGDFWNFYFLRFEGTKGIQFDRLNSMCRGSLLNIERS